MGSAGTTDGVAAGGVATAEADHRARDSAIRYWGGMNGRSPLGSDGAPPNGAEASAGTCGATYGALGES